MFLVLEHVQSDLKKVLKSSMFLEDLHLKTIIYEVLKGVKYMHDARVVHRDIKPANILINQDCSIKICDFGLSRSIFGVSGSRKIIENEF